MVRGLGVRDAGCRHPLQGRADYFEKNWYFEPKIQNEKKIRNYWSIKFCAAQNTFLSIL